LFLSPRTKITATLKGTATLHGHYTFEAELPESPGQVFFDQHSHLIVAEKASIAGTAQEIDYTTTGL
jgi:hypothetical protein